MYLINEDLARVHIRERHREAANERLALLVARARRARRRAEQAQRHAEQAEAAIA